MNEKFDYKDSLTDIKASLFDIYEDQERVIGSIAPSLRDKHVSEFIEIKDLALSLLEKIQKFVFNRNDQQAHTEFYQILQAALQNAQVEFSSSEQKQIGEALSFNIINSLKPGLFTVSNKREKEIKAILRQLRGE